MLTTEENELLTRVGPGTRMGALLRRYWHPVAASAEMHDRWTKRVRILGEDLVLFKDRTGGPRSHTAYRPRTGSVVRITGGSSTMPDAVWNSRTSPRGARSRRRSITRVIPSRSSAG